MLYGWMMYTPCLEFAKLCSEMYRLCPYLRDMHRFYSSLRESETKRRIQISQDSQEPDGGEEAPSAGTVIHSQRGGSLSCSLCDMAVRGLHTVCLRCRHGGHPEHMKKWFEEHEMCPAGCGCCCVRHVLF